MHPLQLLAGIGAEPVTQSFAELLEAFQRRTRAPHGGLAVQQVCEERLVLGVAVVALLEPGERVGVVTEPAGCAGPQQARRFGVA